MSQYRHRFVPVDGYGGLAYCERCGGGEGSIPTDCPGMQMPALVEQRVYACALDFVAGHWIVPDHGRALVIRFPAQLPERALWELRRANDRALGRHEMSLDDRLATRVPLDAVDPWDKAMDAYLNETMNPTEHRESA